MNRRPDYEQLAAIVALIAAILVLAAALDITAMRANKPTICQQGNALLCSPRPVSP
jgi:hypothetical protein